MSIKHKYCAVFSNELVYRHFNNNTTAIKRFKLLAIKRNANLTDISIRLTNKWSRVIWAK